MKSIHHIAIKYLTYPVLDERKIDNKQEPVPPPTHTHIVMKYQYNVLLLHFISYMFYKQEPTHRKVCSKPHHAPRGFLSMVGPTSSNSRQIAQH